MVLAIAYGAAPWGLIAGQTKLAASLRGVRNVGKPRTVWWRTGLRILDSPWIKYPAAAVLGAEAMRYSISRVAPIMAESAALQSGAWYTEMTEAYRDAAIRNADDITRAYSESYEKQSPTYTDVAVSKIWAEQEARYKANLQYPTFPIQSTETEKANTRVPYQVKIL